MTGRAPRRVSNPAVVPHPRPDVVPSPWQHLASPPSRRSSRTGRARRSSRVGPGAVLVVIVLMVGVFGVSWHYGQLDRAARAGRAGQVNAVEEAALPTPETVGVPRGAVLKPTGSLVLSVDGAVVDGVEVNGSIRISANNVTVRNTRVIGSDPVLIHIEQGMSGVVIADVEVVGTSAVAHPVTGVLGPAALRQVDIRGVATGVVPSSGSQIDRCLVRQLMAARKPAHSAVEGIHIGDGQREITVTRSVVDAALRPGVGVAMVVENLYGAQVQGVSVLGSQLNAGGVALSVDGSHQPGTLEVVVRGTTLHSLADTPVLTRQARLVP